MAGVPEAYHTHPSHTPRHLSACRDCTHSPSKVEDHALQTDQILTAGVGSQIAVAVRGMEEVWIKETWKYMLSFVNSSASQFCNSSSNLFKNTTGNNQMLGRRRDNDRRSKRFCSNTVLCVSFIRQMVKIRVIRLRGVEGRNARDQITFCAFHSFLVEVQTNAGYMHATHA